MVKITKRSIKEGSKDLDKMKRKKKKDRNMKENSDAKRVELSSKELKVNIEQLQKDVKKAYGSMMKLVPESVKADKKYLFLQLFG